MKILNKKRTTTWDRLGWLCILPLGGAMLCTSAMASTKNGVEKRTTVVNIDFQDPQQAPPPQVSTVVTKRDGAETKIRPTKKPLMKSFFPVLSTERQYGKTHNVEKRYILVNGKKVTDLSTFYGVTNAQNIVHLNAEAATRKYGKEAAFGAVEIKGKNINWLNEPLVAKTDQVKFPPPIVKSGTPTNFYPRNAYKHNGEKYMPVEVDKRYIVINGEAVKDNATLYGVSNAESISILSKEQAIKIYGKEIGKNGAVEIKGTDLKYLPGIPAPPFYGKLNLDRTKGELLRIPDSEAELKTLTVYNSKNAIVYNNIDYQDDWKAEFGNYKEFAAKKLPAGIYTYFMKIDGKPLENKRGQITVN
ncbi:gliding motility-associated C-terminal domain-containing protein [Pedobacter sp. UC225_65]|uniref:T9SS type B sorting domain-containing protein n=1 Tax=Pedobacter sp. UC225_65 TaxID=3350173 RepID=UPI00366BCBF3